MTDCTECGAPILMGESCYKLPAGYRHVICDTCDVCDQPITDDQPRSYAGGPRDVHTDCLGEEWQR